LRTLATVFVLVGGLIAAAAGRAELNPEAREEAQAMVEGKFYLRLDAPCIYGRRSAAGSWWDPLLEVSPKGHRLLPIPVLSSGQYVYWGSGPDDAVGDGTLKYSGDTVYVWLVGWRPAANEFVIKFVDIKTLDDFKAAWAQTLSPVPLEEEHPEWPAGIRDAIANRTLVEGMTKEQAFAVVGEAQPVETTAAVETWRPRQVNGIQAPYRRMKDVLTGFPITLKFTSGKLTFIGPVTQPEQTPPPPPPPERPAVPESPWPPAVPAPPAPPSPPPRP
jgi:hypothetical protein